MRLIGGFDDAQSIVGGFGDSKGFVGTFGNSDGFTGSFGKGSIIVVHGDYPIYDGATDITPKANEQTVLETAEKLVLQDITVFEVPYFQVSNPQGGNTAYIAMNTEVN